MSDDWYINQPISKDDPVVFGPANRCIYCPDGKPPFTREHVIPRGMGGGIIYREASCEQCRIIIQDIETYCMRGPFLSHRLTAGLVNDLSDLGATRKMTYIKDGQRHQKEFAVEDYPKFLILPRLIGSPNILTHGLPGNLFVGEMRLWGNEEQLRALHAEGNFLLADNYDMDKFGRAIAKIAHGAAAGQLGLDNFEPLLSDYILGKAPERAAFLIGDWPEDGMARRQGLLHQVGMAFRHLEGRDYICMRLRLFADLDNTPIYQIIVGPLTKPIDDVLAPLGQRVIRTSE
jgi:hypothetical protein